MNNQIHSYSFPLADGCQNSFIAPLKSKHFLIAGATNTAERPASLFHTFKYEEDTPKKSSSQTRSVSGAVFDLLSSESNGRELSLALIKDANYKVSLVHPERISSEEDLLETLYEQEGSIEGLHFKKDLNGVYVWEEKSIGVLDIEKKTKSQWVSAESTITSLAVDTIHEYLTYATEGRTIHVCDKRSSNEKFTINACPKPGDQIISMDYNPNKQCYLMTCHQESLKFWDIRRGNLPVRAYQDHHNLLTRALYNPSHDELIACAYDDGTVGLLRLHSVCSSPQTDVEDTLVRLYDEHEDSVFRVSWSAFSPWVFASVTYNASSLVVNIVPSVEKYRILL